MSAALLDRAASLSKRERIAAAATAAMLAATALYVLVLEPVGLRWLEAHRRAEQAEAALAELALLVERRDLIERDFELLKDAVAVGTTQHALKVALLSEIDSMVRRCGLSVASIKPTTVANEGAFIRLGAELQVRCEAHTLLQLMQAMQESGHLLNTEALSLAVGPGSPPLTAMLVVSKLAKLEGGGP